MRSTIREQSVAGLRLELRALESTFLRAVETRARTLVGVLDPRTGRTVEEIRLREHVFSRHARTDSQLVHRALLRAGHTASEIETIINVMPVNAAAAWRVEASKRRLRGDPVFEDTGVLIAAACWSPLDELAHGAVEPLPSASASDAERIVTRLDLPRDAGAIWLAMASTTGWRGALPAVLLTNAHCVYFQPAPYDGWTIAPGAPMHAQGDWFTSVVHPETEAQLERRLARWFDAEGRAKAMAHSGLSVDEVMALAGVPAESARAFLSTVAHDEAGRWLFEGGRSRLLFLGP